VAEGFDNETSRAPARRRAGAFRALAALSAAAATFAVAACGDDDSTTSSAAAEGCPEAEAPEPKDLKLKAPAAKVPAASGVEVVTSCGTFTIEFDQRAPKTAASFEYLAEQGAYDDTVFHRVIADTLIQGGDPLGTDPELAGTGGPGYFVDEPPPRDLAYTEGTVAMAKTTADPIGRSGSQFFVVVQADAGLTPDYALVGQVGEGMDVVERISDTGEPGADGPPLSPVVIESVTPLEG
jgi:peptidyl-prolyl cis-trans isomerase B (cyclophilin B)